MKLFHYTSLDAFKNIWKEKRLLFSESKTTNDIFERHKSLRINGAFISECLKTASEKQFREFINNVFSEIEGYKQISLCTNYEDGLKGFASPMMWGQYARKKNSENEWIDGVCIELDDSEIEWPSKFFYRGKVEYGYDIPMPVFAGIDITASDAVNTYIEKNRSLLFFSKHMHWSHESEYRLVCKGEDSIDISKAIKGIYVLDKDSLAFNEIEKLVDNESLVYFLSVGGFDKVNLTPTNLRLFNQLSEMI